MTLHRALRPSLWPTGGIARPLARVACLALVGLAALVGPAGAVYECYEVLNVASAAFPNQQSALFQQDTQIIGLAARGNGVVNSPGACKVLPQASPDMTTRITTGCTVVVDGATATVTTGNFTHSAAHATLSRIDIASAPITGVKTVTTGTAAATPLPPTIPDGHVVFAFVTVPPADTAIAANQITDKRMCVKAPELLKILAADETGQNVATAQPWFPAAGAATVQAATTYRIEGLLAMTRAAGAVSHTTGLLFGGTATLTGIQYHATANVGDVDTLVAPTRTLSRVATNTTVKAASTSATEAISVLVAGILRVNAGGTFIPQFIYSAAPGGAPTIKANSWFRLTPVGSNTFASDGWQ